MKKFKFFSAVMGNLFKRREYDPTQFEIINKEWDETASVSNKAKSKVSEEGKFQNFNLPLEEKINLIKQKLELFDEALPNLKK